jgi:hypothetical protein
LLYIADLSVADISNNSSYAEVQKPWFSKANERFEATVESISASDEMNKMHKMHLGHWTTSMKVKTVVTLRNRKKDVKQEAELFNLMAPLEKLGMLRID